MPFANVFSVGDVLHRRSASRRRSRSRCGAAANRRPAGPAGRCEPDAPRARLHAARDRRPDGDRLPVPRRRPAHLGQAQVGQISILELIVILIISDAVQNSMVGENTTIWGGLVAVATLLDPRSRAQVASTGTIATRPAGGRRRAAPAGPGRRGSSIARSATRASRPTTSRVAIRRNGLERVEDVRLAVLETDGSISVVPMRIDARR